jgi:hypothetical protein
MRPLTRPTLGVVALMLGAPALAACAALAGIDTFTQGPTDGSVDAPTPKVDGGPGSVDGSAGPTGSGTIALTQSQNGSRATAFFSQSGTKPGCAVTNDIADAGSIMQTLCTASICQGSDAGYESAGAIVLSGLSAQVTLVPRGDHSYAPYTDSAPKLYAGAVGITAAGDTVPAFEGKFTPQFSTTFKVDNPSAGSINYDGVAVPIAWSGVDKTVSVVVTISGDVDSGTTREVICQFTGDMGASKLVLSPALFGSLTTGTIEVGTRQPTTVSAGTYHVTITASDVHAVSFAPSPDPG